jgi:hypothetical protein
MRIDDMAKVTLSIMLPPEVSKKDLEHFLLFKFMGHGGDCEILSKFKHEELDVDDFEIDMRD